MPDRSLAGWSEIRHTLCKTPLSEGCPATVMSCSWNLLQLRLLCLLCFFNDQTWKRLLTGGLLTPKWLTTSKLNCRLAQAQHCLQWSNMQGHLCVSLLVCLLGAAAEACQVCPATDMHACMQHLIPSRSNCSLFGV